MVRSADGDKLGQNQRHKDLSGVASLHSASLTRIGEDFLAPQADDKVGALRDVLKRAGKLGPEDRKLFAERLLNERFRKWGLQGDDLDATSVRMRFAKLSGRLSEETLRHVLETAESIARAERAKAAWNPKAKREQYRRLSRTAVSAARLVEELAEIFPPPWEAERAPIGALIAGLAAFLDGALIATSHVPRETHSAVRNASKMLQSTRRPLNKRTGKTHWELIADLVWLASGKSSARLSERSIRRYVEEPNRMRYPEHRYWNTHWNDLVRVERLVPIRNADPFEMAAVAYLTSLD